MMKESELLTLLNCQLKDTIKYGDDTFSEKNRELLDSYNQELYGNEISGRSQVVSSDHFDTVESDMPSLARIFLGHNKIMHFKPFGEEDAEECRQKTEYAHYLIRGQEDSFKIIHDWIKEPGLAKCSVVKFYPEDTTKAEYVTYNGVSLDELTLIMQDLEKGEKVKSVDVESKDELEGETYNVNLKVIKKTKKITIANVPPESWIITKGASSIQDAAMIGDECTKRKGDLIKEGYSKELVKKLTPKGKTNSEIDQKRLEDQGGYDARSGYHWTNEEVTLQYLYPLVDYDEDGIPERRMIVKCGNQILENEPYGIEPYAVLSQILMPHTLIGKSRGEVAARSQKQKTAIERGIMDNIYAHSRPRLAIDDGDGSKDGGKIDLDDLMTQEIGGVIRVDGSPLNAILPILEPYIGNEALQIVQYIESKKSNSLGTIQSNQGLDSDEFYKETATRFNGVQDSGQAKIELVGRVYAETGFRQLFKGVIWTAQHYQDEATEIMVLGKPLKVDPTAWRHEHYCQSGVGLGAGDSDEAINNLAAQLSTQMQLIANQSPLVDWSKIYATLDDLTRAMGKPETSRYYNDPEVPEEQIMPMLEKLMQENNLLKQQAQQNPLAEAELVKANARMAEVQGKETNSMRQFIAEMEIKQQEFYQKQQEFQMNMAKQLTELELKYNKNVQGSIV